MRRIGIPELKSEASVCGLADADQSYKTSLLSMFITSKVERGLLNEIVRNTDLEALSRIGSGHHGELEMAHRAGNKLSLARVGGMQPRFQN